VKTVALVGFAEATRNAVIQSKADEIWTVGWGYIYGFIPRIDRLFEMHPIWMYEASYKPAYLVPRLHWNWLHQPRDYPVYLLKELPEIPNGIVYPLQAVTDFLFGINLMKGGDPASFYSSSFDYMMALAIYEGFECIEIYGFEMGANTEYRYQREGASLFIGQAMGRGIQVKLQCNTALLKGRKYGYEGGQMIFRQDLEHILAKIAGDKRDATARLQHLEGQRVHALGSDMDTNELDVKIKAARDETLMFSASEQTMIYLIREIDLEEPEFALENPLEVIQVEPVVGVVE
jgi:hypothetical protein